MTNLQLNILDPSHDNTVVSTYRMTPETQHILEKQFGFLPDARLPQEATTTNWNPLAYIEILQGLMHQVNLKSILPDKKPVTQTKRLIEVTPDERKAMVSHRDYSKDNEEWIEYQIGISYIDQNLQHVEKELGEFVAFLQSLTPGLILRNPSFVIPDAAPVAPAPVEEEVSSTEPESAPVLPEHEVLPELAHVEEVAPVE